MNASYQTHIKRQPHTIHDYLPLVVVIVVHTLDLHNESRDGGEF